MKNETFNDEQSGYHLFLTDQGEIKTGINAYLNNKFYNVSILPKYSIEGYKKFKERVYRAGRKPELIYCPKDVFGLQHSTFKNFIESGFKDNKNVNFIFQTSLSKVYSLMNGLPEKNLIYLNQKQIYKTFLFLGEQLKRDGILCDFDESNLIRLDLFINLKTKYGFWAYRNYLKSLRFTRKDTTQKENSFLYSNKQNQLSIYDKRKELELWDIHIKNEIMRIENRFLTKNKIRQTFSFKIDEALYDRKEHLKQMKLIYEHMFKKKISGVEIDLNYENIINENSFDLRSLQTKIFFYTLMKNFDQKTIESFLRDKFSKSQFYKLKSKFNEFYKAYSIERNFNLVTELKLKYENEMNFLDNQK